MALERLCGREASGPAQGAEKRPALDLPSPASALPAASLAQLLLLAFRLLDAARYGRTGGGLASEELVVRLAQLPLLPLLGAAPGQLASPADKGLFFLPAQPDPADSAPQAEAPSTASGGSQSVAAAGLLEALQPFLSAAAAADAAASGPRFLDPALERALPDAAQREALRRGLRRLGVRELEVEDVADLALLPALAAFDVERVLADVERTALTAMLARPLAAGLLGGPGRGGTALLSKLKGRWVQWMERRVVVGG
jgi:hypothetical protein